MLKPNTAEGERNRLKTLNSLNVFDSLFQERFDRLTRMAQRMFGVPIALVSLVDSHHQWFKSKMGHKVKETSKEMSYCEHVILSKDVLVIQDTMKDERFADNPLVVKDPEIRFYAGCPLNTYLGSKVGTLCLIDRKVREFSYEDKLALTDLAHMVENELAAVQMATIDELTDLLNRRGFLMSAKQSLKHSVGSNLSASVVFFDLNDFKAVNDVFGHGEGDRALVAFADCLRSVCSDSDIIARFGGDEFIVFLSDVSKQQAKQFIHNLTNSLKEHNQQAQCGYDISFSYGMAKFSEKKHRSIKDLLSEADLYMLQNKREKVKV